MARKTQQVETRLIAEYVQQYYGKFQFILGVPLGAVSEDLQRELGYAKAIRLSRPTRPEADAIILHDDYLTLIEAKVWHIVDGAAKLPLYASLVPKTPELRAYQGKRILMELVTPWTNPNLETMCRSMGVRLVQYSPLWINDVVARVQNYSTAEYRVAREEKLRNRALLGLE